MDSMFTYITTSVFRTVHLDFIKILSQKNANYVMKVVQLALEILYMIANHVIILLTPIMPTIKL